MPLELLLLPQPRPHRAPHTRPRPVAGGAGLPPASTAAAGRRRLLRWGGHPAERAPRRSPGGAQDGLPRRPPHRWTLPAPARGRARHRRLGGARHQGVAGVLRRRRRPGGLRPARVGVPGARRVLRCRPRGADDDRPRLRGGPRRRRDRAPGTGRRCTGPRGPGSAHGRTPTGVHRCPRRRRPARLAGPGGRARCADPRPGCPRLHPARHLTGPPAPHDLRGGRTARRDCNGSGESRTGDRVRQMHSPLEHAHVLVTGATGFVGQAVVEKLLSAYPTTRISLLVRPRGELSAQRRAEKLLRKPVFRSWRESVGEENALDRFTERVTVIPGDLEDVPELPDDLDVVVHSASSVSFDLPVDEAFAANVAGPVNLYERLLATGTDPHVVHVPTSYVAGRRKGVAEERRLAHDVDHRAELRSALAARDQAEEASRRPETLEQLLRQAEEDHRRAGPRAVAHAAETARAAWVREELVSHGRTRAMSLGWPDVYTFTKAMGERVAEDLWQGAGHRLSVVRPTIIESSLRHPFPGWIDGFKVADPLIAAYARGLLPEFPALADTVLDVIPVDFVVNAILAAAAVPPAAGGANYYQVSSGITNPLRFGKLYEYVRRSEERRVGEEIQ